MSKFVHPTSVAVALMLAYSVHASEDTIGPRGINSVATGLSGMGALIGQVEVGRPGKSPPDTEADCCNNNVVPAVVYARTELADPNEGLDNDHALYVASVMISSQDMIGPGQGLSAPLGVAPDAELHSSAFLVNPIGIPQEDAALAAQTVAGATHAINMSFGLELEGGVLLDGSSTLTSFVDWSSKFQEVLYVVGGNQTDTAPPGGPVPTDNFNGITVGASSLDDGIYRKVSALNVFDENLDAFGVRTSTDILAPGALIDVAGPNGSQPVPQGGNSFSAPHVTGTHALLQQQATTDNGLRHQVMKAVILNSADKIEDVMGMERTVIKENGNDWFATDANSDPLIPVDREMGVGHLNANRAVQQHAGGEHQSGGVPIGWDYAIHNDPFIPNSYSLSLEAGDFVSATLAWDRDVILNSPFAEYQAGDEFLDFGFADLNLYLVPAGQGIEQAVASSTSTAWNLEHIFASVPMDGDYHILVTTSEMNDVPYALAWWTGADARNATPGDYDNNGSVGPEDYDKWKMDFGSTTALAADGNGNGVVDAADYTVWRDNLSAGSGSVAAVPEPGAVSLAILAAAMLMLRCRRPLCEGRFLMHVPRSQTSATNPK